MSIALYRHVFSFRPYQHGADMLAAISQVLNECTKPDQASPAAIVLQGLQALCEAEVRLKWLVRVFHVLLVDHGLFS